MLSGEDAVQPTSDSFWELESYRRTVKRQEDGNKLCGDLMQLITDRGHIEKEYAKSLRGWSKKWGDLIEKGAEYGTTEMACKSLLHEADQIAELHLEVRERLLNNVHNQIKVWRAENYHKSMVGQCKETKELEDGFKKAQKPWAKRLQAVQGARKQFHRACKTLESAQQQLDELDTNTSGSRRSLSFAQKPWGKKYGKVVKARTHYHSAVKAEKTATNQENNSRNDSGMSQDQVKKAQEKSKKCRQDVEITEQKYRDALAELNDYNPKYMEDMTEVFVKSQAFEKRRLTFFKGILFDVHACLDLSVNPKFRQIYTDLHEAISEADDQKDLKWWSANRGVDMAMNWPTFEEYSEQLTEISKKKASDATNSTVTLRRINSRYHEEFVEYAPEPHTISRKEKRANNDPITLTGMKQNDTPTHVPVQQSYSNMSSTADDQTPPPSATTQVSQNRPPPKLERKISYDPSLNPFSDEPDTEEGQGPLSPPVPSPCQSKASSSQVSFDSQSDVGSRRSHSSCLHSESDLDPNPFSAAAATEADDDDDDDVLVISPRTTTTSTTNRTTSSSGSARRSVERESASTPEPSSSVPNSDESAAAQRLTHRGRKGLAPRLPPPPSPPHHHSTDEKSGYDAGLNPFGDDEDDAKENQQSSKRSSNNGSAMEDWTEDAGTGDTEQLLRVAVRALYDYNQQEEDELTFKSGDVFIMLRGEDDQGWCMGEKDGRIGLYPKEYVEVI